MSIEKFYILVFTSMFLGTLLYFILFVLFHFLKMYKLAFRCLCYVFASFSTEKVSLLLYNYACKHNVCKHDCNNCKFWNCRGDKDEKDK